VAKQQANPRTWCVPRRAVNGQLADRQPVNARIRAWHFGSASPGGGARHDRHAGQFAGRHESLDPAVLH